MNAKYFVSSCCQSGKGNLSANTGGLHHFFFNEGILNGTTIDGGNIRGLTQTKSLVFYVKDNILLKVINNKVFELFNLPCHGHDVKYKSATDTFLFVGTEFRKLYELSITGKTIREIEFDYKYWLNCIAITTEQKMIIFLSCKRPCYKSKIVVYDKNFKFCQEYVCPAHDEIHSPYVYKDKLYWCRSNKNLVVKANLDSLNNTEEVIVNNDGYTRGLHVDDDFIIVGTSENRHAETSKCMSKLNQGCIHTYRKNGNLVSSFKIGHLEVYDILKYSYDKNYM